VIMVNRPKLPKRKTFHTAAEIMDWLEH